MACALVKVTLRLTWDVVEVLEMLEFMYSKSSKRMT